MPRWSRQEQHGVRKDTLHLPRFLFPNFSTALVSSQLCFLLFEFYTAYQIRAQLLIFVANTTYQNRVRSFCFA
jgi:hypothetical protein